MAVDLKDKYSNIFQVTAVESAANTLTFGEINLGLTIFQKVAILINRIVIDWSLALIVDLAASTDSMSVGLVANDQVSSIALRDSSTIWKQQKMMKLLGTAANGAVINVVEEIDLSMLPGGGELIAPKPLYWAIHGTTLTDVFEVTIRFYFQVVELKDAEYLELLESRHFYGG